MAKLRPFAVAGMGLAAVLGCAPEDLPLPPVVWEGEMVRVRMDDPGIQVCGGTFEALDRHAALVREALLLEGDGVIEYSIGNEDLVDAGCVGAPVDSVVGCATHADGHVFTTIPFHPHEIVHATRISDLSVDLSSVFEEGLEGLATLLGADDLGQETGPLEVSALYEDAHVARGQEYFRAGHTMAILIERHGTDAFRRFDEFARTMREDAAFPRRAPVEPAVDAARDRRHRSQHVDEWCRCRWRLTHPRRSPPRCSLRPRDCRAPTRRAVADSNALHRKIDRDKVRRVGYDSSGFMTSASCINQNKLRPFVVAGMGLAAVLGCAPEELPLPPVVWEGEMVRVRMDDPGIQVCGGTFEALDRHAALVREALFLEGDGVIEYSMGDEDFVHLICTGPAAEMPNACTFPDSGRVYTSVPYVPHEIVHSTRWLDPRLGRLSSLFEEGLATLFGADWPDNPVIPLDALELLDERYIVGLRDYDRAGQFVSILLKRHRLAAFREFDELARTAGEDAAFSDVFGETKAEFAAIAETMPICEQSQWWMPLVECDGEPITADPETGLLTLTGNVSCGELDVKGPEYGRMWTSRRFRLDSRTSRWTSYDEFEFPEDATLEIVSCHGGCPQRFAYIGTRYQIGGFGDDALGDLEPGEYFLRLTRPLSDDDGTFEIIIDPA